MSYTMNYIVNKDNLTNFMMILKNRLQEEGNLTICFLGKEKTIDEVEKRRKENKNWADTIKATMKKNPNQRNNLITKA